MRHLSRALLVGLIACASGLCTAHAEFRTWTKVNGEKVEAELVGQSATAIKLKGRDGALFMWSKDRLSESDRAHLGSNSPAPAAAEPAPRSAPAASAPNHGEPGALTKQLSPHLVSLRNGRFAPVAPTQVSGVKFYGIYFSAGWCGPCHRFTPELVQAYQQLKARHPEFEVIFVSSDRSETDMRDYIQELKMPWPAVRFEQSRLAALKPFQQSGIPNLVFVDADGKVLSESYVNGQYVGPRKVVQDIRARLSRAGSPR